MRATAGPECVSELNLIWSGLVMNGIVTGPSITIFSEEAELRQQFDQHSDISDIRVLLD